MRYGHIAHLDKPISKLIIGADWFEESEEQRADEMLDAFAAVGGNCIDMAHVYGGGQGQRIVGRWLAARGNRDQMVLLDKGCHPYGGRARMTPEDLDSDLSDNLERLGLDCIDLFVLHRDDTAVGVGPIVERLNEHVQAGQIKAFGGSNWTAARVAEANRYAEERGLQGFSMSNPNLSLASVNEPMWAGCVSASDEDRLWHEETGFPLFSWSSQGGGFFVGRETDDIRRVYWNDDNFARRDRAKQMASEKGCMVVQLVLAWVLNQPFPTWALIGPRTPEELRSSLPALDIELSAAERDWLEWGVERKGV